ncbi:hypothetical protein BH10PSE18_BH10PSE18_47950 [soil metagenome]
MALPRTRSRAQRGICHRKRHTANTAAMRVSVFARHTRDPSRCRAKPTCRLAFGGATCHPLLSGPPSSPLASAPGSDPPPASHGVRSAAWRAARVQRPLHAGAGLAARYFESMRAWWRDIALKRQHPYINGASTPRAHTAKVDGHEREHHCFSNPPMLDHRHLRVAVDLGADVVEQVVIRHARELVHEISFPALRYSSKEHEGRLRPTHSRNYRHRRADQGSDRRNRAKH